MTAYEIQVKGINDQQCFEKANEILNIALHLAVLMNRWISFTQLAKWKLTNSNPTGFMKSDV